ncbi:hypothetical protein Tco_0742846, partial [Tanacetum coccineum]
MIILQLSLLQSDHKFTALEQVVKELKQDDHFAAILALIRSQ